MTSIAPPYYNELADLIEKSNIDPGIKNDVVNYIKGYNLGKSAFEDSEKKKRFNLAIKEVVDKDLIKVYKESGVLLGKIKRNEELNQEEKEKYDQFITLIFLWKIANEWYYKLTSSTENIKG